MNKLLAAVVIAATVGMAGTSANAGMLADAARVLNNHTGGSRLDREKQIWERADRTNRPGLSLGDAAAQMNTHRKPLSLGDAAAQMNRRLDETHPKGLTLDDARRKYQTCRNYYTNFGRDVLSRDADRRVDDRCMNYVRS